MIIMALVYAYLIYYAFQSSVINYDGLIAYGLHSRADCLHDGIPSRLTTLNTRCLKGTVHSSIRSGLQKDVYTLAMAGWTNPNRHMTPGTPCRKSPCRDWGR